MSTPTPHGEALLSSVEAAVDALRAGGPVCLLSDGGPVTILAAEGLSEAGLAGLTALGAPDLVLTHPRAATLKMRLYTPRIVALPVGTRTRRELAELADPAFDLANPLRGPFHSRRDTLPPAYATGVKLAKLAGLLPAVLAVPGQGHALTVESKAIDAYDRIAARNLHLVSEARVPLAGAESARILAFRPSDGGPEHLAIIIGDPAPPGPVLVRLHSECFTGDLLGSLKCDCGDQLRGAIRRMGEEGAGIVLYLAQEGRGIGLMNKLRAYRLQDQGFDTMEANTRLGFEEDERVFEPAAEMLKRLGFTTIRLLTNNPDKMAGLSALGLTVVERVAHAFPANPHNVHYLRIKRDKAGHDL